MTTKTEVRQVWKYTLASTDNLIVEMPADAEILSVASQRGEVCVWALVDPSADMARRAFRIAGTGHRIDVPEDRATHRFTFVGSVLMTAGLVWHLFDLGECG